MRTSMLVSVVVGLAALAAPAAVRAEHAGPTRGPDRTLTLAEIHEQVRPVAPEISRCYLDARGRERGGEMTVQLGIHRRGKLESVSVQTPGVPRAVAAKIETCVRAVVAPLEFPVRRAPTTAVVPYHFQRTVTPGGGPQLSCWNPRGCRS